MTTASTARSRTAKNPERGLLPGGTDGRSRVVIERVAPEVDGGRFPVKRVSGELVEVKADVFADGHDRVRAVLLHRREDEAAWTEVPMRLLGNDCWHAAFAVDAPGRHAYTVTAWIDHFATWRHDLERRPTGDPDLSAVFATGAALVTAAAAQARNMDARRLQAFADALRGDAPELEKRRLAADEENARLMDRCAERTFAVSYPRALGVVVDRPLARFSAWYEFFPRSCGEADHGSFRDCEGMLAYVASLGFDVVYLPPVHPVGRRFRKGPNNTLNASVDVVGSPWAIGGPEGGHKALHPALGTMDDFRRFIERAGQHGLEVALDLAFQCSPDHPYVKDHPEWFRRRPDGSIQYAENPPKKYQDIYPFDFESADWEGLWLELKSVVTFWIAQGVKIFRVDNPHTKSFAFWEWLITEIKRDDPDVLFLAEAFTRPRVMHRLAKLGFTQSYTYFTWRNNKAELVEYFTELTQGPGREYFRPNLWPNTPDILNEYLQFGGRPAFMIRLALAATLGASYGIYGPAFELADAEPREPGSEEYRDSEKYQVRRWDLDRPDSLRDFVARVNAIRRDNPALQSDWSLQFHAIDNEQLLCFSKATEGLDDIVLVVVNLDPHHRQSGWVELPLERFGIVPERSYQMHDLLGGARFLWHGPRNYVELDPHSTPAHIFRLRRRVHREHDFDYFL